MGALVWVKKGLVVPLSNVVSTLLMLACVAGAVVGGIALALRFMRPAEAGEVPSGLAGPGSAADPGGGVGRAEAGLTAARLCALVLVLAWAAGAARMAPDAAKASAVGVALAVAGLAGGFLVLGPARAVHGGDSRLLGPGNFGLLVAGFAAAAIAVPDAAARPWIALGAAVGVALPVLAAGVFGLERRAVAGAMLAAQAAALAGALVWGDRIRPQQNLGVGLALGFAGAVSVVGAVAAIGLPASMGPLAAVIGAGVLTAAVAYPVIALALREPAVALPAALGGGMAALIGVVALAGSGLGGAGGRDDQVAGGRDDQVAGGRDDQVAGGRDQTAGGRDQVAAGETPALPGASGGLAGGAGTRAGGGGGHAGSAGGLAGGAMHAGEPPPFLAMLLLILAGGSLLLINRLYGMTGLSLAGVGLAALAAGDARAVRWLAVLLPAAFGGRALLHYFLDRTYLRLEGVDVTQTYAFAALILGFVVATALVRFRTFLAPGLWAGAAAAVLLAASPVLVGYFIHILPLAGFLAGVIAAGFGLAALCDGLEAGAARLGPYMVLVCGGAAVAAPFLQEVINAPRQQRVLVFLVVSAVALWYAVSTLRSQSQRSAAA